MGYWNPPGLHAYDPTVRVLDWKFVSGKVVPGEYDMKLLEDCFVPRGSSLMNTNLSMPTVKGIGAFRTYQDMIILRTPDDPERGGLCPDSVNDDGSITIQYFDFSDSSRVRRKRVTWISKGTGVTIRGDVPEEWDREAKVWKKEGPDAEREFSKVAAGLAQVLGTIASAVLAVIPGGAPAAAVFQAAWGFALKSAQAHGVPPTLNEVLEVVGGAAKAISPGVWGIVSKNEDLQNLFKKGFIAKMAELKGAYSDKIAQMVTDLGGALPRFNLPVMAPGFDLKSWATGAAKAIKGPPGMNVIVSTKRGDVPLSSFTSTPSVIDAWDWAWKAFVEPDPENRWLIRRNFLWSSVGNSSAIRRGESTGLEAHAATEEDQGLLSAGSFFDQYLASLLSSTIEQIPRHELGTEAARQLEERRRADPEAKASLYALVADLRSRYRM